MTLKIYAHLFKEKMTRKKASWLTFLAVWHKDIPDSSKWWQEIVVVPMSTARIFLGERCLSSVTLAILKYQLPRGSLLEKNETQFPAPYWISNRANTIARLPVTRFERCVLKRFHSLSSLWWYEWKLKRRGNIFRNGLSRGRSWVQLRPDQHLGSLNNWGGSAAFVITSANG